MTDVVWLQEVMFGDQVRAAAASGHTQDLARLLSRPDPHKFSPDSVSTLTL